MSVHTISRTASDITELIQDFLQDNEAKLIHVAGRILNAFQQQRKLILFGNGGSASQAEHLAAEFVGRFRVERNPFAAIALTSNSSILTAIGNDYGYEDVFARQVKAFAQDGDIAIAISTSGTSPNVIAGVKAARLCGVEVVGISGKDGGELIHCVDHMLLVPSEDTARIQEVHMVIGHVLCDLVEQCV